MGILKRKRSESEFSFSSESNFSSPTRPGSSNFTFGSPVVGASSQISGRTMKRFRDNRLPEEVIHQNTLKMLYSAQQQQKQLQPHDIQSQQQPPPTISTRAPTQRSLHAFFHISSPATARTDVLPPPIEKAALAIANEQTRCEDCGTRIPSGGDDDKMEVDGYFGRGIANASRCVTCAKLVCAGCSVSNMGADPRCLVCAGTGGGRWGAGQGISAF